MASDSARSSGRSPSLLTAAMLAPWLRRYLGAGSGQGGGSEPRPPVRPCHRPASPGNVQVATGGGHVQGRPALVVRLVHRGALLHQEAHHLQVLVDTGLGGAGQAVSLGSSRPPAGALGQLQAPSGREVQGGGPTAPGQA